METATQCQYYRSGAFIVNFLERSKSTKGSSQVVERRSEKRPKFLMNTMPDDANCRRIA